MRKTISFIGLIISMFLVFSAVALADGAFSVTDIDGKVNGNDQIIHIENVLAVANTSESFTIDVILKNELENDTTQVNVTATVRDITGDSENPHLEQDATIESGIPSGSEGTLSFAFTVPEDAAQNTYSLDLTVESVDTQSQTHTQIIEGYSIIVSGNTPPSLTVEEINIDRIVLGDVIPFNTTIEDDSAALSFTWTIFKEDDEDGQTISNQGDPSDLSYTTEDLGAQIMTLEVKDEHFTVGALWVFAVDNGINATTFDGTSTQLLFLTEEQLASVPNPVFEKVGAGKIDFTGHTIDFSSKPDLDNIITLQNNLVSIDSAAFDKLNQSARITMTNLPYTTTPILRYADGPTKTGTTECPSDVCSNVAYDAAIGTLTFDAAHFSTFWTEANQTQFLIISDLDVKVDSKTDKDLKDTQKISKDIKPGSKVEFELELENIYTEKQNIEIRDIVVNIEIKDIDDGDDLTEESEEFELDADDTEKIDLTFNIPMEIDEKTYDVVIEVEATDQFGNDQSFVWNLDIEVDKDKHDVVFRSYDFSSSTIGCSRNVILETEVINIGADDEDEVRVKIENEELGISRTDDDIEIDEGTSDNKHESRFNLEIDENIESGIYPFTIKAFYDSSKETDEQVVELNVVDCVEQQNIFTPVDTLGSGGARDPTQVELIRSQETPSVFGTPESQETEESGMSVMTLTIIILVIVTLILAVAVLVIYMLTQ